MNLKTYLGQLQLLAILEGISYLSFAATMPLKYMLDIKGPNYFVGMAHGILFIAYCLWVGFVRREQKISYKIGTILLVASLVPFMTFWVEKKILKKLASKNK